MTEELNRIIEELHPATRDHVKRLGFGAKVKPREFALEHEKYCTSLSKKKRPTYYCGISRVKNLIKLGYFLEGRTAEESAADRAHLMAPKEQSQKQEPPKLIRRVVFN